MDTQDRLTKAIVAVINTKRWAATGSSLRRMGIDCYRSRRMKQLRRGCLVALRTTWRGMLTPSGTGSWR